MDSTTVPPSSALFLNRNQHELAQTLSLIAALANPIGRKEIAHTLAQHLKAEELIVFVKDAEIALLLPAPGFAQTLPCGQLWHAFLAACVAQGQSTTDLPFPDAQTIRHATGFATEGAALVLLGSTPLSEEVTSVRMLLPLLQAAFSGEQATQTAKASAAVAQRAAQEAKALAVALDGTRETLQGALVELYRLERQKDEFLSVASHELRTPLTTLKGLTQLTRRKLEGAGVGEFTFLQLMDLSIIRMERLIRDLLDVTRINAGVLALRLQRCNLVEICQQAVEEQRIISNREIMLEFPDEPVMVEIDAERISQVLSNFLLNALKYTKEKCPISVRLWQEGDQAHVAVHDEGKGIPIEALPHLFERFYRAVDTEEKSGSEGGLGLGLYICRTIVELHHGYIGVESQSGKGSTFWVRLPCANSLDG